MLVRVGSLAVLLLFGLGLARAERLSERMPARQGETCLVCNGKVGYGDAVYRADGQRVALHAVGCESAFLGNPRAYTAALRPSNALFSAGTSIGLAGYWLWTGLYVLLALVSGGLGAHFAVSKGRSPAGWFLACSLLPVIAALYLLVKRPAAGTWPIPNGLRKLPLTRDPSPCPFCGHTNHPAAMACPGCGTTLKPQAHSEVAAGGLA